MDLRQLEILKAVAETGRSPAPAAACTSRNRPFPPDPAARGRAERAALLAHQAQGQDHAGRRSVAAAGHPRLRRHPRDHRAAERDAAEVERHDPAGGRDDGLDLRLSGAAEGVSAPASGRGREGDDRAGRSPGPAPAGGHGGSGAADVAGERAGPDHAARDARGTAAGDLPGAPADAEEGDRDRRI